MHKEFKDIVLAGNTYRIGRLKASDGSWIFTTFTARYREYVLAHPPQEKPENYTEDRIPTQLETVNISPEDGFMMTAQFLLENVNRAETEEIQKLCLHKCFQYGDRSGEMLPMPILFPDGRFAIASLEYQGSVVFELTKQCIAFNVAPYFPDADQSGVARPATDLSALHTRR